MICCYQVTKICCSRYGFAIASSAWDPCNFGPSTDLEISVSREMSMNIVFTIPFKTNSNDFGGFLELIRRFEFELRRRENYIF